MEEEHQADTGEERRRELIQRLLGPAVHRLNNSMAVVGGLTALLQQQELDPERRRQLESVAEQAGEATALIRELGRLPDPGPEAAHDCAEVELESILRPFSTLVRPVCRSLRVEFEGPFEAPTAPDAPAVRGAVRAPARALVYRLTQLAVELLPKERERAAGGTLTLAAEAEDGRMALQLAFRPAKAAGLEDPGTGVELRADVLGGAVERAESWGGSLELSGSAGEPRLTWRLVSPSATPSRGTAAPRAAARILVLESDAQLGSLIGDVLRDVGHAVEVCPAPDDVEDLGARAEEWDLVLIDARSPTLVAEVERATGLPAARMCGVGAEVAQGETVLLKPFRPRELIDFVAASMR